MLKENSTSKEARDFSQVQVISRAASILRTLRDKGGLNLSQLAREVHLPRSTVFRIVNSLEAERLITTKGENGVIQLGLDLVSLGAAVSSDLRSELRPYLEGLSLEVGGETVDLAILDVDHLLFIDQITPPRRLRAVSGVGIPFPLHCSANGKAILSALSLDEIFRIIPEQLKVYTATTIPTRIQLLKELEQIKIMGVAFDREEHTPGICAVGSIVNGPNNKLAAISIPVPSIRFKENEERLVQALLETRDMINLRFHNH